MPDWDHEGAMEAARIRRMIAAQDEIDMKTQAPEEKPFTITLPGGGTLTAEGALLALHEALPLVQSIGTTGCTHRYPQANRWLKKYFPSYAD